MNTQDDDAFGAFLAQQTDPYQAFTQAALLGTASALEGHADAQSELDAAYAVLQDAVAPLDPSLFRAAIERVIADAIRHGTTPSDLRFQLAQLQQTPEIPS